VIRAALAVALAAHSVLGQEPAGADLDELRGLYRTGKRVEASAAAEALIARAGKRAAALLALGRVLGTEKDLALAERAFALAAAAAPDSYEAHFNLALTRFQRGASQAAVQPAEKAAALNPVGFDAAYLAGVVLSEAGRKTDAIRRLRSARRANPGHAGALSLLGVLYAQEGYPADAMEVLEAARKADPSREPVWLAEVEACHEAFEFEKALRLARETAAKFPDSADARFRLGFELETAGEFEQARAEFEAAVARSAGHVEARIALGRSDLRAGHPKDAVRHLEAALAAQPSNALARVELAKALVADRDLVRAKEVLTASPTPDLAAAHLLLAQIYQAEGNTAESTRERVRFQELTASGPAGGMAGALPSRRVRRFEP
jgi:tetratricopeptide (TPR) repeat protein